MGRTHAYALALIGLFVAAGWFLVDRALDPDRRPAVVEDGGNGAVGEEREDGAGSGVVGGPLAPANGDVAIPEDAVVADDVIYTREDVRIFEATMAWARAERLDTLPIGRIIALTGRRFVGNDYTPHTLDLPGPERLVVNLREFDCVTYLESVLALARLIREGGGTFADFTRELRTIRYRNGTLDGYVSRLHYFTEWIANNADNGLIRDITAELGGRPHQERIDFMSTHVEAYPNLDGRPERVEEIREIERALSQRTRSYIPQDRIGEVASGIRDGDIIAATSSVQGLDVAHTGFALWRDGRLHLMHAPLVGRSLEISDQPLATRILRIDGQDGIIVARPL